MTAQDQNNTVPDNTNAVPVPTDNGMMVSGPSFPSDSSTKIVDTSVLPEPITDDSTLPSFAASPVIPVDPMTSVMPVVPEPADTKVEDKPADMPDVSTTTSDVQATNSDNTSTPAPTKDDKKNDGKDSPLESLAKKLAQLKSEFIEDVPTVDETKIPNTETAEVTPEEKAPLVPESKDLPPIVGNDIPEKLKEEIKMSETPELTQPIADVQSPAMPVEALNTPLTAPTVETPAPEVMQSVLTGTSTPLDSPAPANDPASITGKALSDGNKGDGGVVDDILKQYETELHGSPASPNTAVDQPVVPVVDMKPEIPSASLSVPLSSPTPDAATGSEQLLNENDNTQVKESDVELQSQNTKYPVSINKILDEAIERNSSDVLISVGYPVMIRIDGTLVAINDYIVSAANAKELILPVLSDQKKELLEVNREVDLAYSHRHGGEARFRINAFFTQDNLAAAFRLIPTRIRTIEDLNLPPILNQFSNLKQGLVLVTGPTGHGKSTTLAAMIQAINTNRSVHILTIEDPIEYIFPKAKAVVDQREMHDDTHSWDIALKSALRQNPDVILVGEMRDYETISSTITLAETGHLVFATLHTNSAAQTIDRIIDVFPENQQAQVRSQLSSILQAVVAQRLIPIEGGGRRAVCEIMLGTPAVNNLIREGKTQQLDNVIRTSADVGMNALEHSLVALVREGLITVDSAQEYAVHPEEIIRLLKS